MTPLLIFLSGGKSLEQINDFKFGHTSLGNLGQASTECIHHYVRSNHIEALSCNKGRISDLIFAGLMPTEGDFEADYCGKSSLVDEISECTNKFLLRDAFESNFNVLCSGKSKCHLNFVDYIKNTNNLPQMIIYKFFNCFDFQAKIYVQY